MPIRKLMATLAACALMAAATSAQAQAPDARLRDQLRQSVTELRKAQDENSALKAELETLRRNGPAAPPAPAAAPAAPAANTAELRRLREQSSSDSARAAQLQEQLAATQKVLEQWQDSQKKAVLLARTRDADATRFETELQETRTAATACEAKNVTLVKIADELIVRYRDKSAWSSLRDKEALFGSSSIEFEKLGQEYRGRVIDASVQLPDPSSAATDNVQENKP